MLPTARRIYAFYRDGFCSMTTGRTLWKIIAIKLFVMFAIVKLFFFPNYLNTQFQNDQERADVVLNHLTGQAASPRNILKGEQ